MSNSSALCHAHLSGRSTPALDQQIFTDMAASYDFVQLDVFTRTPLAGNPLAVFTDARGLTDKQMQALAREMNLSETTFILPREPEVEATNGKRVRIFTTREELPFAGHPTLGTALYLYSTTDTAPDEIVLDLERGEVANHDFRHASHLHIAWVYLTESSSTNEAAAKCVRRCVDLHRPWGAWKSITRPLPFFGSIFWRESRGSNQT
jgi:predicted PhzF superfamily epimerase YddE/YHI9